MEEKNYTDFVPTLLEKIPDSIWLTVTRKRVFEVDIVQHAGDILSRSKLRGSPSDAAPSWIQRRKGPYTTREHDKSACFALGPNHQRIVRRL